VADVNGSGSFTGPRTSEIGTDWRHRLACLDEDPELFFPVGTSGPAAAQLVRAKAVCSRCPVTTACLNWSLATGQGTGVWGGRSEAERRDRGATQREARPGSIIAVQGRAAPPPETTSDRKRVRAGRIRYATGEAMVLKHHEGPHQGRQGGEGEEEAGVVALLRPDAYLRREWAHGTSSVRRTSQGSSGVESARRDDRDLTSPETPVRQEARRRGSRMVSEGQKLVTCANRSSPPATPSRSCRPLRGARDRQWPVQAVRSSGTCMRSRTAAGGPSLTTDRIHPPPHKAPQTGHPMNTPTTSATPTPAADPGRGCAACPHPWDAHDRIGMRYCSATTAAGAQRGCVCVGATGPPSRP